MISAKNTVLTNSRIHDGASDPRKTVAPFHTFYGHGRRTSGGRVGLCSSFAGGGGGVKNIIEALTFWERIPTDPLTRTGLSTLQLSRPSVILTVLSSHFQIRSKGADVNDTNIQKPSYAWHGVIDFSKTITQ